jgi:hypothetical protein
MATTLPCTTVVVPNVMAPPDTTEPPITVSAPNVVPNPARMEPSTTARAPMTTAVPATMEPSKTTSDPMVTVEWRAHATFSALAPFIRMILAPAPISMVVSAWKRNSALGSPCPSKITVAPATIEMAPACQVPGVKVIPPISGRRIAVTLSRGSIAAAQTSVMSAANSVRSTILATSPSSSVYPPEMAVPPPTSPPTIVLAA